MVRVYKLYLLTYLLHIWLPWHCRLLNNQSQFATQQRQKKDAQHSSHASKLQNCDYCLLGNDIYTVRKRLAITNYVSAQTLLWSIKFTDNDPITVGYALATNRDIPVDKPTKVIIAALCRLPTGCSNKNNPLGKIYYLRNCRITTT